MFPLQVSIPITQYSTVYHRIAFKGEFCHCVGRIITSQESLGLSLDNMTKTDYRDNAIIVIGLSLWCEVASPLSPTLTTVSQCPPSWSLLMSD